MNWSSILSGLWGAAKPYATDPGAWLGAAGTGLGIYDIIRQQKLEKDYLRRQKDWMSQVQSIANAPLNVEAIFNPGKALISRDLEAGLAERGLQPGGAYESAMGEGMMRHWLNAADIASRQRSGQLSALMGTGPVRSQFPAVGDTSSLGKYLQSRKIAEAQRGARAEQRSYSDELMRLLAGMNQQPQTDSFDPSIPDMELYPSGAFGDPDADNPYGF